MRGACSEMDDVKGSILSGGQEFLHGRFYKIVLII